MDVFHLIYKHIKERQDILAEHLVTGAVQSMEQYRSIIGGLTELKIMLEEIKNIERKFIDE
jgi:hypothetical protein